MHWSRLSHSHLSALKDSYSKAINRRDRSSSLQTKCQKKFATKSAKKKAAHLKTRQVGNILKEKLFSSIVDAK